jgi:hypothetical protein
MDSYEDDPRGSSQLTHTHTHAGFWFYSLLHAHAYAGGMVARVRGIACPADLLLHALLLD